MYGFKLPLKNEGFETNIAFQNGSLHILLDTINQ